ncbi:citramalate synthase [Planctomycetota bacterium]|nr:citramalate synthase [Planctomycetota bacterium]
MTSSQTVSAASAERSTNTDQRLLEIYDTTLRDGSQGEGVNFSLADKLALSKLLDWLGVHYIEGGWPGSNPKDEAYFREVRSLGLKHAKISAFGSTRHAKNPADGDPNLRKLVDSGADVICIFGKTWDLHVREALRVSLDDNLAMIGTSVAYLAKATGRPVFYDAEHFFDGFKANPGYALDTVAAAHAAGAQRLVLCDTNGGSLPDQVVAAVAAVRARLPSAILGIHVHNDGGLAVANTLAAVAAGCDQIQGTINGIGERCGNVDLCAVIANAELKLGWRCLPEGRLVRLTEASRAVWERANMVGPNNQPFVGRSAFAHKGGIHVSAVQRNALTYEHVAPETIGNERRVLVSELSGRSSVQAKLADRYPALKEDAKMRAVLDEVMGKENRGWSFESAESSFELIAARQAGVAPEPFVLHHYRVSAHGGDEARQDLVEATVKITVAGGNGPELRVAEGHGPVDALWHALRSALVPRHPHLEALHLMDYKVRVVDSADGTAARVRTLVESHLPAADGSVLVITTIGVNEDIIAASWEALTEAVNFALLRRPTV